jgi:hypothetical protein
VYQTIAKNCRIRNKITRPAILSPKAAQRVRPMKRKYRIVAGALSLLHIDLICFKGPNRKAVAKIERIDPSVYVAAKRWGRVTIWKTKKVPKKESTHPSAKQIPKPQRRWTGQEEHREWSTCS